jgi:hypothetical protein
MDRPDKRRLFISILYLNARIQSISQLQLLLKGQLKLVRAVRVTDRLQAAFLGEVFVDPVGGKGGTDATETLLNDIQMVKSVANGFV